MIRAKAIRGSFALAMLFFLSGISGLIYQVVWFRMLTRAFGVTVYAVTTVLVVFMAGLAIGSFAADRLGSGRSSLRTYGVLELLVGVTAAASSLLIPALPALLGAIAARAGSHGELVAVARGVLSGFVLLPSTLLMGGTLPVLSGYLAEQRAELGNRAGLLYGVNTLGAVVGVLAAGFVLIAALGEKCTILVAVAINLAIGAASLALARRRGSRPAARTSGEGAVTPQDALSRQILFVSLVSGASALALEVIWFRVLTAVLGNSVYAFSCMLGAYLAGIGIGSVVMSRAVDRLQRPILVFGALEIAAALVAIMSLRAVLLLGLAETRPYARIWETADFLRIGVNALLVVLPTTLVLGAIFPVATRIMASASGSVEAAVGRLYGYNTIGSIIGSFITGFILIPALGTRSALLLATTVLLVIGVYLIVVSRRHEGFHHALGTSVASVVLLGISVLLSPQDPFVQVVQHQADLGAGRLIDNEEDRGATVSVVENAEQVRTLYINGLYVSNTWPGVGEQMLNFPLAFDPQPGPKRVLAVGLGVGASLRYAIDVGHEITVVELHPAVIDMFRRENADSARYLENPRAHVVLGDGRNYLLGSKESYDLILVDGSPPVYASGMVNLYSLEFTTLARAHLSTDGAFVVWFPVVCFEDDFWMAEHNFAETFTQIATFAPPGTSNAMLMGADGPAQRFTLDLAQLTERLGRWRIDPTRSAVVLTDGMRLSEGELREKAARYPPVTDDRPHTEFPLFHFLRGEPYYADNAFLYPRRFPRGTHICAKTDAKDCASQCDAGQADSCFFVGASYLRGRPSEEDEAHAAAAFRLACDGGYYGACNNLGGMAQSGHGLPRDDDRADAFFRTACDGGVLVACYNLALAEEAGRGASRDEVKARRLLRYACRAQLGLACQELQRVCDRGDWAVCGTEVATQ